MSEDNNKQEQIAEDSIKCEGTDSDPTVTSNLGFVRYIANAMQLVGYYLLIHDGFAIGLMVKGVSDILITIWAIRNKLWDVVAVTSIFCVLNFQRLVEVTGLGS